jgi:hypothetical protein
MQWRMMKIWDLHRRAILGREPIYRLENQPYALLS